MVHALLLVSVMLGFTRCASKADEQTPAPATTNNAAAKEPATNTSNDIAYINTDSLLQHYLYAKDLNEGFIQMATNNRREIESHPMFKRITMFEGDSTSPEIAMRVYDIAKKHEKILVCLDSNHTHDHVLKELKLYAPLVTEGSYCVVFDTIIEDLPDDMFSDRPWGHGNNPKTAVREYLKDHPEFIIDKSMEQKLLVTVAPSGYLKRIK